jgi:hypothetical protein
MWIIFTRNLVKRELLLPARNLQFHSFLDWGSTGYCDPTALNASMGYDHAMPDRPTRLTQHNLWVMSEPSNLT